MITLPSQTFLENLGLSPPLMGESNTTGNVTAGSLLKVLSVTPNVLTLVNNFVVVRLSQEEGLFEGLLVEKFFVVQDHDPSTD